MEHDNSSLVQGSELKPMTTVSSWSFQNEEWRRRSKRAVNNIFYIFWKKKSNKPRVVKMESLGFLLFKVRPRLCSVEIKLFMLVPLIIIFTSISSFPWRRGIAWELKSPHKRLWDCFGDVEIGHLVNCQNTLVEMAAMGSVHYLLSRAFWKCPYVKVWKRIFQEFQRIQSEKTGKPL